ncbi:MAG: prepilin-type N-terminal cleavage/methylation domain-containing protein [Candidatus Staskawiczbacteria bacterium]
MNKSKGFTIIELIVVIAIIAILAAIVMVNVTQYINKSKTAAVQANLDTAKTQMAADLADAANSYFGDHIATLIASGTALYTAIDGANGTNFPVAAGSASTDAWCASSVTLTTVDGTNSSWCVDSIGHVGPGACSTTEYTCD